MKKYIDFKREFKIRMQIFKYGLDIFWEVLFFSSADVLCMRREDYWGIYVFNL